MKDSSDQGTTDLFEAEKRIGRPPSGRAKSGAERQRAYRKRAKANKLRLNLLINADEKFLLKYFARRYGVTETALLERLIMAEKDRLFADARSKCADQDEWEIVRAKLIAEIYSVTP